MHLNNAPPAEQIAFKYIESECTIHECNTMQKKCDNKQQPAGEECNQMKCNENVKNALTCIEEMHMNAFGKKLHPHFWGKLHLSQHT
jgi:hypothetical protein